MPVNLRQNRGLIVAATGVLFVIVLMAVLSSKNEEGDGSPSSYSTLRRGGKAAFQLLAQTGYPVARWEDSPQKLPQKANDTVLIIAGPESFPTSEEQSAIGRFVLSGGGLLLVGVQPHWFVPRSSATQVVTRVGYAECKPVAPTHLTRGGAISQDGTLGWDYADESQVVHYADADGNPVVVSYRLGQGNVIWWASAVPLINSGIRDKGNLDLLLNSIGERRHVLWDEYYHGHRTTEVLQGSMAALKWGGLQLGIVGIVLLLTFSRRNGPIVPLVHDARLSPFEFVETLGNVFHRAQGRQVAVEIAHGRFRQIAARRLGLRGHADGPDIVRAMRQHGLEITAEIERAILSSEDAGSNLDLSEKTAIDYVRRLNQASALVGPGAGRGKEKGSDAGHYTPSKPRPQ
jgi:hypothetical protein